MLQPQVQLLIDKFDKSKRGKLIIASHFEKAIYSLRKMSGDLLHTQHKIREIPSIINKQNIDRILLLGTGSLELLQTLQQRFPHTPIESFDDKKSKPQSDMQVDYGIREKYKHQRILVLDETFNVGQGARNIKRLVEHYPSAYAYYLALTSTGATSQDTVTSINSAQFVCDVDTQADRTESLTLHHYNFYTRELGALLGGRPFNDKGDRRLIEYIQILSDSYLHNILLQNKQIGKNILSEAIDGFLASPLGKQLLRARPQEAYQQMIQYISQNITTTKLIECTNTLFNYKDILSDHQIESLLDIICGIICSKKYIQHQTFKIQLIQLITKRKKQTYETICALYQLGEFALAEQYIANNSALQKRDFSGAINIYKEYAKKEIEQLCEYGAIPGAYKIQRAYFPQDEIIISLIQKAEKEQKRQDKNAEYRFEPIPTDSTRRLPRDK